MTTLEGWGVEARCTLMQRQKRAAREREGQGCNSHVQMGKRLQSPPVPSARCLGGASSDNADGLERAWSLCKGTDQRCDDRP